jgi:hypothetical protein
LKRRKACRAESLRTGFAVTKSAFLAKNKRGQHFDALRNAPSLPSAS